LVYKSAVLYSPNYFAGIVDISSGKAEHVRLRIKPERRQRRAIKKIPNDTRVASDVDAERAYDLALIIDTRSEKLPKCGQVRNIVRRHFSAPRTSDTLPDCRAAWQLPWKWIAARKVGESSDAQIRAEFGDLLLEGPFTLFECGLAFGELIGLFLLSRSSKIELFLPIAQLTLKPGNLLLFLFWGLEFFKSLSVCCACCPSGILVLGDCVAHGRLLLCEIGYSGLAAVSV
jgi:hypothetical protein